MKRRIVDKYCLIEEVGEGAYGKVYRGVNTLNNQDFAIKVIPIQKFEQNPKLQQCTTNEIKILSKIESNPCIIKFIELHKTKNNFYFIYQYCNGKTLDHKLKQQGKLSEKEALRIFKQLIEAFQILNKYNIMHRDLKPDNIFFHNNNVKLGDFGFCKTLGTGNDMTSTMLGSPIYMAPQVLKAQIYTSKADIWSLGVVLYEMLFGVCPFESNSIAKLINTLEKTDLSIPLEVNNISKNTQNLLKKMLIKDQFKRIDWFQLLNYNLQVDNKIHNDFQAIGSCSAVSEFSDYQYKRQNYNAPTNGFSTPQSFRTRENVTYETNNPEYSFKKKSDQFLRHEPMKFQTQSAGRLLKPRPIQPLSAQFSTPVKTNVSPLLKKKSLQQTSSRRKNLLQLHNSCLISVRTAINFIKSQDPNGLLFSFFIFRKIQNMFYRACDCIGLTSVDLQDVLMTINNEIKPIQRQKCIIQQQLRKKEIVIPSIESQKFSLKSRFNKGETNLRLWYQMISFLTQQKMSAKAGQKEWESSILDYIG